MDRFWGLVGKDKRFSQLARLMKALLCIPHSNASSERTFSMVKKIVTENRTSLNNSTLCALLSCKINFTKPASKYTPSKKTLRAAKSATYIYITLNSSFKTSAMYINCFCDDFYELFNLIKFAYLFMNYFIVLLYCIQCNEFIISYCKS